LPPSIFFVDSDESSPDGVIRCKRISSIEALGIAKKMVTIAKWLLEHPVLE